jgi:hypothetical protein
LKEGVEGGRVSGGIEEIAKASVESVLRGDLPPEIDGLPSSLLR